MMVDDPVFKLMKVTGKYKDIIKVEADKNFSENWGGIIEKEVEKIKKTKHKPLQSIIEITDSFYWLDSCIGFNVPGEIE